VAGWFAGTAEAEQQHGFFPVVVSATKLNNWTIRKMMARPNEDAATFALLVPS
jgi:hypothetical protein